MAKLILILFAQLASADGLWLKKGADAWEQMVASGGRITDVRIMGDSARFVGYVQGIFDVLHDASVICPPRNAGLPQGLVAVAKYLRDHPEGWELPEHPLVSSALSDAFPCSLAEQFIDQTPRGGTHPASTGHQAATRSINRYPQNQ